MQEFMDELKSMVNEIVHFVRYASKKTIAVEPTEEKETKKEKEKGSEQLPKS